MAAPQPAPTQASGSDLDPAAIRQLIESTETDHLAAVGDQHRLRGELRAAEQRVHQLDLRLSALRDMLVEADPEGTRSNVESLLSRTLGDQGAALKSLAGLPRVKAIEAILTERSGEAVHRREIFEALRTRGFPTERLGDTSAALAYLNRNNRAVGAGRGYWRVPEASSQISPE